MEMVQGSTDSEKAIKVVAVVAVVTAVAEGWRCPCGDVGLLWKWHK